MISTFVGIAEHDGICSFYPETETASSLLLVERRQRNASVLFWAAVDEELACAIRESLDDDDGIRALYLLEAHATFLGRFSPGPIATRNFA